MTRREEIAVIKQCEKAIYDYRAYHQDEWVGLVWCKQNTSYIVGGKNSKRS